MPTAKQWCDTDTPFSVGGVVAETPMNFVLHFTIPNFVRALGPQSTFYFIAYSQTRREPETEGFVLLTSDAGVDGGTVHVLQLRIKTTPEENALDVASEAAIKIVRFLTNKGASSQMGVLLTAGLQDAIKYWGGVAAYSLQELDSILEKGKEVALSEQ